MSKQAIVEFIKAASFVLTLITYFILLSAVVTPGRAFAAPETTNDLVVRADRQLCASLFNPEIQLVALPVFANYSQKGA